MCGIAGVLTSAGRPVRAELVLEMAGELLHRGPDGVGLYLDAPLGMAAARLAVIDLVGGQPPISNEDGRYWVVQNGEIYNFPELRETLRGLGHRFATRSDTEVLAHAFEQWGEGCLERLNGAFAFALWDRRRRRLFLARDRFGIRPLFVAELGGDLVFASEAKAILRHPAATRALDPACVAETFVSWACLPERSAFPGIRELPPGHFAWWRPGDAGSPVRWWDLPFGTAASAPARGVDAWAEELLDLLGDATRIRLRADVPVGLYLSGGLDSSTTAALARRTAASTLHGFGIGFADARFDESAHQDRIAPLLGVALERAFVADADIAGTLPEVVALAEKPLLRTAPAPLLLLSRLVHARGMKVVLTGEGADELFAGYNIFREAKVRRFWARRPDSTLRPMLLRRLYPYALGEGGRAGAFVEHFFRQGLGDLADPLYSHRIRFTNTSRCLRFLGDEARAAAADGAYEARLVRDLPPGFERWGPLDKAQYLEIKTFLQGYLLHSQGDRMLMGNAVEGRFPFLDHRVAEFAARVPETLRMRGLTEKYLLRRAAGALLPAEVCDRPKQPFRAPIARGLAGPGAPAYVRELTTPERLAAAGIFAPGAVAALLAKAETAAARGPEARGLGETDEMALVGVLSTMLLHEHYVARPVLAPAARPSRVVVGARVVRPAERAGWIGAQHGRWHQGP